MFLIDSCFHCDIWLGLISNSFDSYASVFCSLIAAKATMALNMFVNFLRFVVIFPNVFIPGKTTLFPLNSCSQFWGTLYDGGLEYFETIEEAAEYIGEIIGKELTPDFAMIESAIDDYMEEHDNSDESWMPFHRFEVVDD